MTSVANIAELIQAVDRFMFRIGQLDNPMVFPLSSNYSRNLLHKDPATSDLYISPKAPGADKIRYSTNWGSSFSKWISYTGANITLEPQAWTGTKAQEWSGDHVIVHYWSRMTGSSDHVQHADVDREGLPPRRWPHVFVEGSWNEYGYDGGLANDMSLASDGLWKFKLVAEWPTNLIMNVWGMNPNGVPDKSQALGDVDGDFVLDWVPPDSLARNVITIPNEPSKKYIGYELMVNDGNYHYYFNPIGSSSTQVVVAVLLGVIPVVTAILGVWIFKRSFYKVKFNEVGVTEKTGFLSTQFAKIPAKEDLRNQLFHIFDDSRASLRMTTNATAGALAVETGSPYRRTVMIATMEYDIDDWEIKVKIGGLGVMAQLMCRNLGHQNLVWVVPCIGGIEYPVDESKLTAHA